MKKCALSFMIMVVCALSSWAMAQDIQNNAEPWPAAPNPLETGLCKDGNCPCGNDFCPKGGHCLNDTCYCTYSDPVEESSPGQRRDNYLHMSGFGEFACGYDLNNSYSRGGIPVAYCDRENGCHTKSGAYFPKHSFLYQRLYTFYRLLNMKTDAGDNLDLGYYLVGNPDALDASLNDYGDCVFPAQPSDSIPKVKVTSVECSGVGVFDKSCGEDVSHTKTIEVVDTKLCQGGKHYCHGRDNKPAPKPDGEGYACLWTGTNTSIRTWVCTLDDGCICGGKSCAKDNVCINNTCMSGKKVKKDRNKNETSYFALGYDGVTGLLGKRPLIDFCGRESAEKVKTNIAEVTSKGHYKSIDIPDSCDVTDERWQVYGCVTDTRTEPDYCQWRQTCDPWNIPRANRDQYICEFKEDLYVPENKMGCYYYPKAVGLKCVNKKGCVCKNGTIKKGEYCNAR